MILDYNRSKIGVDLLDQKLKFYRAYRRTPRWPFLIFMHLVDIALYNGYILWTESHPEWETGRSDQRKLYYMEIAKALILPQVRISEDY